MPAQAGIQSSIVSPYNPRELLLRHEVDAEIGLAQYLLNLSKDPKGIKSKRAG